jgi:hypothetical protein
MISLSRWRSLPALAVVVMAPTLHGVRARGRAALPVITSLTPKGVYAGTQGFTLVVTGAQFEPAAQVRWNGAQRPTTFIGATRLTAAISAQDVAAAGGATVTVANPSAVGGTSNAVALPIVNPVPTIASVSPPVAPLGGEDFGLIVNGSGFVQGSGVRLNGAGRVTTFVSSTRLVARIQASDLTTPGTAAITVVTPGPGGGASAADTLGIRLLAPTVAILAPNVREVGSTAFTMRVTGSNFTRSSVARWNGANRSTTFVSPTQLDAAIPASDVDLGGFADVTVASVVPNLGAQTSNPLRFTIATPRPVLVGAPTPLPIVRLQPVEVTFNGSDFMPQMVVRVHGVSRPRNVVSSTQVRVRLDSTDVLQAGPVEVRFENPAPTVGPAVGSLGIVNPSPVAASLAPQNALVGGQAFTLTVTGSRFVPGSVVNANGSPRPTTFVSQTQLRASIPASDLTQIGDLPITVVTPQPGGGTSAALHVTRLAQQVIIRP